MPDFLRRLVIAGALLLAAPFAAAPAAAEDGYDLWLRYRPVEPEWRGRYAPLLAQVSVAGSSPTLLAANAELKRGLAGLLGPLPGTGGVLIAGTPRSSRTLNRLRLPLAGLGDEGYLIRSVMLERRRATVIAANSDIGVLRGAFAFLRLLQTRQPIEALDLRETPKLRLRILNHWDNLDRSVERGYSGASLWDWHKLPAWRDPRYADYARANASIGINGAVLTNVNANAEVLTPLYLKKVAALAEVFRPYGIKVYLTARFSAPIEIGKLPTADPLDPKVRAWWKAKAEEIYRYVPDFGGFLVKANSEGQPGPQDYKRSHADGANMLADALKPHGGIVMWRAFVYTAAPGTDRAKQAFEEFRPLDGGFRDNVLLQVKNGPIDFQPREPFHPLFGAMPRTPLVLEAQITKEYLGFATHLAYLGTMWEEVLRSDTFARGPGTPVAATLTGMAGVANVGTDRNWSGSHFDQANWYAFGRLAWDPSRSAQAIAGEWTRMTWGNDPEVVAPVVAMMIRSRQATVDYMTPLGLHHLMATGHHYGPGPWVDDLERPDWNPTYYHRADRNGIGFDRTVAGSNAVAQYAPPVAARFSSLETVPDDYLLWFHHVPWDRRLRSGRTLWDELVMRYSRGVSAVGEMRRTWASLEPRIDRQRFEQVAAFLAIQEEEARWWRDASIAYFQSLSRRPLPRGYAPPAHDLDHYKSLRFPYAPGQ
ncbi:MAG TPA: alpha-glucuronidase family glycosyl hydrolase [Allosphingosinicella sp.]|nr:alpha-glucuronidase family glycosyl hydrolase [Allosphingosinicella sp.]